MNKNCRRKDVLFEPFSTQDSSSIKKRLNPKTNQNHHRVYLEVGTLKEPGLERP